MLEMSLIQIIKEKIEKKDCPSFQLTNQLKEADLVFYKGMKEIDSDIVFVAKTMGKYFVGYLMDQNNNFKEVSNRSLDIKGTSYESAQMYKSKNAKESLPWNSQNASKESIINYFKNI